MVPSRGDRKKMSEPTPALPEMSETVAFSILLLTAPSEKIAAVYAEQLQALSLQLPALKSCKILCVADPSGTRIGSGGGTLNALDFLRQQQGVDVSKEKVLLIHSGGDSRRAPLYSLCGKAWITLNAKVGEKADTTATALANPLSVLIEELSRFATNLGPESLVVASSDVLLDLTGQNGGEYPRVFPHDAVTVVSVPEDPKIATNHGVLVRGNDTDTDANTTDANTTDTSSNQYTCQLAGDYLQKPSVEEMTRKNAIYPSGAQDFAMIDTGVVIFTGRALQAFAELATDPIVSMCTKRRLTQLQQHQGHDKDKSLDQVGPSHSSSSALRFELYSDVLLALYTKGNQNQASPQNIAIYYNRLNLTPLASSSSCSGDEDKSITEMSGAELYQRSLPIFWSALSGFPLFFLHVQKGNFRHLGTSAEIYSLIRSCRHGSVDVQVDAKDAMFARKYSLQTSSASLVLLQVPLSTEESVSPPNSGALPSVPAGVSSSQIIAMNSVVYRSPGAGSSEAHTGCAIVEHSVISGNYSLGCNSVVSHVNASVGRDLQLFDGMMLQQVYLKPEFVSSSCSSSFSSSPPPSASDSATNSFSSVLLLLHVGDDVKAGPAAATKTCFGVQWQKFFQTSGVGANDLWAEGETDRTIWNASLFPALQCDESKVSRGAMLVSTWMQFVHCYAADGAAMPSELTAAVSDWRQRQRFSIADLLQVGDAYQMNDWRTLLQTHFSLLPSVADIDGVGGDVGGDGDGTDNNGEQAGEEGGASRGQESRDPSLFVASSLQALFWAIARFRSASRRAYDISEQAGGPAQPAELTILLALWCAGLVSTRHNDDQVQSLPDQSYLEKMLCLVESVSREDGEAGTNASTLQGSKDATRQLHESILQIYSTFSRGMWVHAATSTTSPLSASLFFRLIAAYTKTLLVANEDALLLVAKAVLAFANYRVSDAVQGSVVPVESHPRILFIAAWVLQRTQFDERPAFIDIPPHLLATGGKTAELLMILAWNLKNMDPGATNSLGLCRGRMSSQLESLAQRLVAQHLQTPAGSQARLEATPPHNKTATTLATTATTTTTTTTTTLTPLPRNCVVMTSAPVRVDLAGGWSDTPPICYESAGSVLNVAVTVDGRHPVKAAARLIATAGKIVLRTYGVGVVPADSPPSVSSSSNPPALQQLQAQQTKRDPSQRLELVNENVECDSLAHFDDASDSSVPCALLKAVMIVLGVVESSGSSKNEGGTLGSRLEEVLGSEFADCGIELACFSSLPSGSGLGGSSIVAAAALRATMTLLGMEGADCNDHLVTLVSQVEQVMTTGGGYQDQVGAIFGGFKIGRCAPGLPVRVCVQPLALPEPFISALSRRAVLLYTGSQRLAKNCLINALRQYSLTPMEALGLGRPVDHDDCGGDSVAVGPEGDKRCLTTVSRLIKNAEQAAANLQAFILRFEAADGSGDEDEGGGELADAAVDLLANALDTYWELKKEMAGPSSEPPQIRSILTALAPMCQGLSLCGAGAGGFAVLILKRGVAPSDVDRTVNSINRSGAGWPALSTHRFGVCGSGISSEVFPETSPSVSLAEFFV